MALVERADFEWARRKAASAWRERGREAEADAFDSLRFEDCRFGLETSGRVAWGRVGRIEVGLLFDLDSGEFLNGFARNLAGAPAGGRAPE